MSVGPQDVWHAVCDHLDGLAIGGAVAALSEAGAVDALLDAEHEVPVLDWAAVHGLRPGYANIAARLLALLGLATRHGDIAGGHATLRLIDAGRDWCRWHAAYRPAAQTIGEARRLLAALAAAPSDDAAAGLPDAVALPDVPDGAPERVRRHLRGPLVSAAMSGLLRAGLLERLSGDTDALAVESASPALRAAATVLAAEGWAKTVDGRIALTEAGRLAAPMAPQYLYPVGYFAMLAAVPALMCGETVAALDADDTGTEGHVDREIDIAFSGLVFARTCRGPLFDLALPLFDSEPVADQPRAIVDCGGGDGTLLCELYRAIASQTERGRHLDAAPLTMIGVEYNPVAERTLARRMRDEGVPGFTFAGDIGDPAAIAQRLAADGFPADSVLHVSKSVFHNRRFRPPPVPFDGATSRAVFVSPDGGLIDAPALEADLAATFAAWRAQLGRHGMIVIEAHCVDETLTAARSGRSVLPNVEALHGFSHQYLVEVEVHRRAAERAGLAVRARREIGVAYAGAPIMSVDYYAA